MVTVSETRDAGLIAALNKEVQDLHSRMHPDTFKPFDEVAVTTAIDIFLHDDNCRAFVAYKDGMPVGYVLVFIRETEKSAFKYKFRSLYIDQIAVLSRYRSGGIGKHLMQRIEELATEHSVSKIELEHWSTNIFAAQFFRKNGYSLYKERLYKLA